MPSLVANCIVCVPLESRVRVTVKVMMPPSVADALATEKLGMSSSMMVPSALAVPIVAPPVAPLKVTLKVSLPSARASWVVCTVKVLVVSPWLKVRVPELAV